MDAPNRRWRSWLLAGSLVALLAVTVLSLARALRRKVADAATRAQDVPLSPLTARWRVGADYPERRGITTDGEVTGEMDDLSAFAGPTFDPEAVAPELRNFYEHTADYALVYDVRWHRPFLLGAALASKVTSRVEQLNLPGPGESGSKRTPDSGVRELESRFVRVDPAADPREGARAWVRTREDDGGSKTAVFVAIYAHHEGKATTGGRDGTTGGRDGTTRQSGPTRYVNIAVPLPGANLSTVLRPENLGDGSGGIELTTLGGDADGDGDHGRRDGDEHHTGHDGDEGLYLVTPWASFDLPLDQRFRVRPAGASDDDFPSDLVGGEASLAGGEASLTGGEAAVVATHEMWLFGRQFLTIRYAAWVADGESDRGEDRDTDGDSGGD